MMDAKARQDCKKEIDLLKVRFMSNETQVLDIFFMCI